MAELKDVIAYILAKYPTKDHLSNARVTKIVYLADWHSAIKRSKQITNIEWVYDSFGPFVHDINEAINDNPNMFRVEHTENAYGQKKKIFGLQDNNYSPHLDEQAKASIDHVIKVTKDLNWSDFIRLVYSTYPIMASDQYSKLNLITRAKEYEDYKKADGN